MKGPCVTAEYVSTPGSNCKYRLWFVGQPIGWTDRENILMGSFTPCLEI